MDLAAPRGSKRRSSLYRGLRGAVRKLGIERFIDDVIARLNNEDRMVRLHKESLYQGLFNEFCRLHQVPHMFYPVGGGANYSLLYLIGRVCKENPLSRVLELGAGQSTLLLDFLSGPFELVTLEHSPFWAEEISSKISGSVTVSELIPYEQSGHSVPGYGLEQIADRGPFDCVLVDGPNSAPRFSRLGVREVVEQHVSEECILIFDDAERPGEQETIALCKEILQGRSSKVFERTVLATSSQVILATQKFERVRFY